MDKAEILQRRLNREIQARKQAEQFLEAKSRELFYKSQELERSVAAERQSRKEAEILRKALHVFTSKFDFKEIVDHLGDFLEDLISFDNGAILYNDGETVRRYLLKGKSTAKKLIPKGVNAATLLNDIRGATEPIFVKACDKDQARRWGFDSFGENWLIIPMSVGGGHGMGCLIVQSFDSGVFSDSGINLIQDLVSEAAIAFENVLLFKKVERLSITDSLTGVSNRRHFDRSSLYEFQRSVRYNFPLTAIMMDIDHFKVVNDTYGHATGDRVLREVAGVCKEVSRVTDLLARYGGEEFCIILPETSAELGAFDFAERIRQTISTLEFEANNTIFSITASFGIAGRIDKDNSISDLLERSDQALYRAKEGGRNRSVIWD